MLFLWAGKMINSLKTKQRSTYFSSFLINHYSIEFGWYLVERWCLLRTDDGQKWKVLEVSQAQPQPIQPADHHKIYFDYRFNFNLTLILINTLGKTYSGLTLLSYDKCFLLKIYIFLNGVRQLVGDSDMWRDSVDFERLCVSSENFLKENNFSSRVFLAETETPIFP